MLTDAEIAGMRDTQDSALPDLLTIKRITKGPDGYGGEAETSILLLNQPCRIKPLKGDEEVFVGVFAESGDIMVTFTHDQLIDEVDQLINGPVEYDVLHIEDSRDWITAKRVLARRVKP